MAACQNVCRDQKFSAPKGIGSLMDDDFGKLTRDDIIIKGPLATYSYNGRGNKKINITEIAARRSSARSWWASTPRHRASSSWQALARSSVWGARYPYSASLQPLRTTKKLGG